MRKVKFETGYFYHIYNRGVEKRTIFLNEKDYCRFLYSLSEFNNINAVTNLTRRCEKYREQIPRHERSGPASNNSDKPLVDILIFCLMPNHFHLILRQKIEGGITKFLHKLGTGYTNYFNLKYKRDGVLFQGTFKAAYINSEEYLVHLSRYIHLNPVEIIQPDWKEQGIQNWKTVKEFLEKYKWSSYSDYINKIGSNTFVNKELLFGYFGDEISYKEFVMSWVKENLEEVKNSECSELSSEQ